MATKVRKVDPKAVAKDKVLADLTAHFTDAGMTVVAGADVDGCTKHTLILRGVDGFDVKVVLTTPKAGVDTYLD